MTARWLRGLLGTLGLAVVVAGVPVFLYGLGGGLPTSVPSAHQVGQWFGQPIRDTDLMRSVSLLCWALWLLFVLALIAEATAWARDLPGPSATGRGFRIPGLQGAAGSLFLTAVLLLPQRTSVPVSTHIVAAAAAAVPTSAVKADVAGAPGGIPYTVQRYDTLWGIAEQHLGNGLRWREIVDASGSTFATGVDEWVQVNGRLIDEAQARIIVPGQILYLPGVPPVVPTQKVPAPAPAPPPSQVHPQPPAPASSPAATTPSTPTTVPSLVSPHSVATPNRAVAPVEAVGLIGAGIVAGGALTTITRLRVDQARARAAGRRIRIPTGELATKEMALRVASRDDLIAATHRALHALAAGLAAESLAAPVILAVLSSEQHVEVLLDRPARPPRNWQITGDGFRWSMVRSEIPDGLGIGREPAATLVPVGKIPGTSTEVMINVEAAGVVAVQGDAERSTGLVGAAALALTGLPWATSAEIVLAGSGRPLSGTGDHLRYAESLEDVLDQIEALPADPASLTRGQLTVNGNRPDGWVPTVIISTVPANAPAMARLSALCASRPGLGALAVADDVDPGCWTLDVDAEPAYIPQLRLALDLTSPSASEVQEVSGIVATALDLDGVGADEAPYASLESSQDSAPVPTVTPEARIKVLGVVDFEGIGDFRRARAWETTLYLAMHPRGVSESELDERIWPMTRGVPASTRDPVISAVRAALGGVERFPYAQGQGQSKIYRYSEQVRTDWTEFCALYRAGRDSSSVEPLREALELVRGRPFGDLDGGPGYLWLHHEGHVRHMQAEIADCADLAAGMYLDSGQPVEARWAAARGLLADVYVERLWVRLMAAADALGEAQEVERLLQEMDMRLGLDGDFESLHPDTVAAYRRHSRRSRSQE